MPKTPPGIHIDRWSSGLYTNRAATSTPVRYSAGHAIPLLDALIDGLNVEISPANTLTRRPGYPKYCSVSYGSETPKAFAGAILNGILSRLLDTDVNVYSFDPTTLTSIHTKATTAQSFFQQVGNILYFSDGVDNKKWDGINPVTNSGLATPTSAPTIPGLNLFDTVANTQTVHAWVPSATYNNNTASPQNYFLLAPTGEVQWAVVPAGATLVSQSSTPNWSAGFGFPGFVTKDGTMTWTNSGPLGVWAASTLFSNSSYITTNQFTSINTASTNTVSGSATYSWTVGSSSAGFLNTGLGTTGNTNVLTVDHLGLSVPTGATIGGITVSVSRASNRANAIQDVTVQLLKAGTPAGSNLAAAGSWPFTTGPNVYTIPTSNGVRQVYGSNTNLWGTTWTPANVNATGFGIKFVAHNSSTRDTSAALVFPITVSIAYTIAASDISGTVYATIITDSNGNLQRVTTSGTSGSSEPTWATAVGSNTTDGGVTWQCLGTANQLPCLFNRTYAYGFHSGSPHLSTLSPTLVVQAPIIGPNTNVQGFGSDDTQTDRIDLYRTFDGGSLLLYDNTTVNVNSSTPWTIIDTSLDTDLNPELIGPVDHLNDPPPTGATILKYHMGRMWAVVGNLLYFSAGPDCLNGDGNQAWPPANVFTFAGPITGLGPTSQGLLVLSSEPSISVVLGGPQLETFWVQPLLRNLGVSSPNCVAQDGDEITFYSSQRQMMAISPSGKNELGFNIAPTLAGNYDPSASYVAIHRAGADQGVFISNGADKIERFNMNAEGWDPIAAPVSGIGPIASINTALGVTTLLSTAGGYIVARDVTAFQDSGASYGGYATVGSLVLSSPGEVPVQVKSMVLTSAAVGTDLAVSILRNEISGSFTSIPKTCQDPYELPASSTINMNRYDWNGVQTAYADVVKHMQVKITLPTEAAKNEIFSLSLIEQ